MRPKLKVYSQPWKMPANPEHFVRIAQGICPCGLFIFSNFVKCTVLEPTPPPMHRRSTPPRHISFTHRCNTSPLRQNLKIARDYSQTRHRASTSMYSLTFCVRCLLPQRHQRKPAAPVTRQSAASTARKPRAAGRSHYVVISRDGRKLVTRVRVMLP